MDYQANEITLLTNEEFLTMLAASGVEKWYGSDLETEKLSLESDKAYNSCLASLYKKELIEWKAGKAVISEAYKPVFKALRDAELAVVIDTSERAGTVRTCYIGKDGIVEVGRRQGSGGEIEINMHPGNEWLSDVMDSINLPVPSVSSEEDEIENLSVTPSDYCCKFNLVKLLGGEVIESMILADAGVYSIIETPGGRENYSIDRVAEILKLWIGGSE